MAQVEYRFTEIKHDADSEAVLDVLDIWLLAQQGKRIGANVELRPLEVNVEGEDIDFALVRLEWNGSYQLLFRATVTSGMTVHAKATQILDEPREKISMYIGIHAGDWVRSATSVCLSSSYLDYQDTASEEDQIFQAMKMMIPKEQ